MVYLCVILSFGVTVLTSGQAVTPCQSSCPDDKPEVQVDQKCYECIEKLENTVNGSWPSLRASSRGECDGRIVGTDNPKDVKFDSRSDCWGCFDYYYMYNNCYNYAVDILTNTLAQPGRAAGLCGARVFPCTESTCEVVKNAVIADGAKWVGMGLPTSLPAKGHYISLHINPKTDFHFTRMNGDMLWSHKPGKGRVKNTDNYGSLIRDPSRQYFAPWSDFCGFFLVVPSESPIKMLAEEVSTPVVAMEGGGKVTEDKDKCKHCQGKDCRPSPWWDVHDDHTCACGRSIKDWIPVKDCGLSPPFTVAPDVSFGLAGGDQKLVVKPGSTFTVQIVDLEFSTGYHWYLDPYPEGLMLGNGGKDGVKGGGDTQPAFLMWEMLVPSDFTQGTVSWESSRPWERDNPDVQKARAVLHLSVSAHSSETAVIV